MRADEAKKLVGEATCESLLKDALEQIRISARLGHSEAIINRGLNLRIGDQLVVRLQELGYKIIPRYSDSIYVNWD